MNKHSPQLYFNRKYSLHYVWDPETLNDGMVRIYSGREIYNALNSINKLTDKEVEDYIQSLHQFIVTLGRCVTRQKLSNSDKKSSIKIIDSANNGCKKSRNKLHKNIKIYIGLHLQKIAENDFKLAKQTSELKNTEFTMLDVAQTFPARLTIYDPCLERILNKTITQCTQCTQCDRY